MREFLDEVYARLEQQQKIQEKEESEKEKEKDVNILEIIKNMQKGKVTLFDKEFTFQKTELFRNKFALWLPSGTFEIKEKTEESYKIWDKDGIYIHLNCMDLEEKETTLSFIKDNVNSEFNAIGLKCYWREESYTKIDDILIPYAVFSNYTIYGKITSIIYIVEGEEIGYSCVVSFADEELKYWKPITIALMVQGQINIIKEIKKDTNTIQ